MDNQKMRAEAATRGFDPVTTERFIEMGDQSQMQENKLRAEAKARGYDPATTEDYVQKAMEWWAKQEIGKQKEGPNRDITSSDR